jgi:hypothetical protein
MMHAASVSFFKPEFDDFLYAAIGLEANEMPLSVLSALSRLNVDPWAEAAELAELPDDTAALRLASLIAQLPVGRWARVDSRAIADRLIALLPRRSSSKAPLAEEARSAPWMTHPPTVRILIYSALVVAALIIVAASHEPSSPGDHPGDHDGVAVFRSTSQVVHELPQSQ